MLLKLERKTASWQTAVDVIVSMEYEWFDGRHGAGGETNSGGECDPFSIDLVRTSSEGPS